MELDFNTMFAKAKESEERKNAEFAAYLEERRDAYADATGLSDKQIAAISSAFDKQNKESMEREIEEAKVRVEREIRAKYEEDCGTKVWNAVDETNEYARLLRGLLGKE